MGGLKDCDINNCKASYSARTLANPQVYLTKDYQINRINKMEMFPIEINTYDIEVDCDTHVS